MAASKKISILRLSATLLLMMLALLEAAIGCRGDPNGHYRHGQL